jgi:hypothetical protein
MLAGLFILARCHNQVTVQGYVYDYNLEGIERAKIVNKRTDSVLYSGKDGGFILKGIHLSDTIIATAPGYQEDHYIFKYYGKYTFRGPIGLVFERKNKEAY